MASSVSSGQFSPLPIASAVGKSLKLDAKSASTKNWSDLYETRLYSDLKLLVGETRKVFQVHRLVLAVQSEVMATMLYGRMKEGSSSEIFISQYKPVPFELFLRFLYTGSIEVESSLVPQVAIIADYYNVAELRDECLDWMKANVSPNNVCSFLVFADNFSEDLRKKCYDFLFEKVTLVINSSSFLECLSERHLRLILQRDQLELQEIELFEALRRWLAFDECRSENKASVSELLSNIRLPLMTIQQLLGPVRDSRLFSRDTLLDALSIRFLPGVVASDRLNGPLQNDSRSSNAPPVHFRNRLNYSLTSYQLSENNTVASISYGGGTYEVCTTECTTENLSLWVDMSDAGRATSITVNAHFKRAGVERSSVGANVYGIALSSVDDYSRKITPYSTCSGSLHNVLTAPQNKLKRTESFTVFFHVDSVSRVVNLIFNRLKFHSFALNYKDISSFYIDISTSNDGKGISFHLW